MYINIFFIVQFFQVVNYITSYIFLMHSALARRKFMRPIYKDRATIPRLVSRYGLPAKVYAKQSEAHNSKWRLFRFQQRDRDWRTYSYYHKLINTDIPVQSFMYKRAIAKTINKKKALVFGCRRWRQGGPSHSKVERMKHQFYLLFRQRKKGLVKLGKLKMGIISNYSRVNRCSIIKYKRDLVAINLRYMRWLYRTLIAKKLHMLLLLPMYNGLALLKACERRKKQTRSIYVIPLFKRKDKKDVIEY